MPNAGQNGPYEEDSLILVIKIEGTRETWKKAER